MSTVRDRIWLWGHEAGSHNIPYGLPRPSRMTPVEGAYYMGIDNLIMVTFANSPRPPYDQYALPMGPLKRVVWSIIGDASSTRNDRESDLQEVLGLARRCPNISGVIMDDFFNAVPGRPDQVGRATVEELQAFRRRLRAEPRPLDLWVVMYAHQLGRPVADHLNACDVTTFWTWKPGDLANLEANISDLERQSPGSRKVLGCYMWDFSGEQQSGRIPMDLMRRQCETGLEWLRTGRIEGMVFLASCICDLQIEAVEWAREWIAEVGGERVPG